MANERNPTSPNRSIEVLDDAHLEESDLELAADEAGGYGEETTAIYRAEQHALPGGEFEDEATRVFDTGTDDAPPEGEFEDEATRVWQQPSRAPQRGPAPQPAPSRPMPASRPAAAVAGVSAVSGFSGGSGGPDDAPMPEEATVITDSASLYRGAAPRQQIVGAAAAPPRADSTRRRSSPMVVFLVGALVAALLVIGFLAWRGMGTGAPETGTIALFTVPSGASVIVDGIPQPNTTPTALRDVEVGRSYTVVLELEGYQRVEEAIVLSDEGPAQRQFELTPATGTLTVRTVPVGASVSIDGVGRGLAPVTVSDLDMGRALEVVATHEGYEPETRQVTFSDGGPSEQLVALSLQRSAVPDEVPVEVEADVAPEPEPTLRTRTVTRRADPAPEPEPVARTTVRPSERTSTAPSAPRERPSATRPSEPAAEGFGTLSVQAVPYGQVWVDGRMISPETPLINHRLGAGTHRVKVYYVSLRQFSDERTVRIEPDGRRTVTFRAE
jgi:hypothetical protein